MVSASITIGVDARSIRPRLTHTHAAGAHAWVRPDRYSGDGWMGRLLSLPGPALAAKRAARTRADCAGSSLSESWGRSMRVSESRRPRASSPRERSLIASSCASASASATSTTASRAWSRTRRSREDASVPRTTATCGTAASCGRPGRPHRPPRRAGTPGRDAALAVFGCPY